jgi:hypothetical protein
VGFNWEKFLGFLLNGVSWYFLKIYFLKVPGVSITNPNYQEKFQFLGQEHNRDNTQLTVLQTPQEFAFFSAPKKIFSSDLRFFRIFLIDF